MNDLSSEQSGKKNKRRRRNKQFSQVQISAKVHRGKFIGETESKPILVAGAVPGDVVDVFVTRRKKSYYEAKITAFHNQSPLRATPFCQHFGVCGGCKWQNLEYQQQLHYKQQQVIAAYQQHGIATGEVLPIIGADADRYYRNKLEFAFCNNCWDTFSDGVGFHVPGRFDKVVDVEHCYLQRDPANAIRLAVRAFAIENGLSFFEPVNHQGLLRNLVIRTTSTAQLMVIVIFNSDDATAREALLSFLSGKFPEITSLFYIINEKKNDSYGDLVAHLFAGEDHIIEEIDGLRCKIGPHSFFQTNTAQCQKLYRIVEQFAALSGKELIYDLYTGAGTIANSLARKAGKVIGLEYVPEAIANARENAQLNSIGNSEFFAGDVAQLLNRDFIDRHGTPDLIVTDPPRAGMHPKVRKTILDIDCAKIVYVSCNPVTQSEDIAVLAEQYQVTKMQAIDMFPHTPHVENVALLRRL